MISGILLAGGRSSRFGTDKTRLSIGGITLLEGTAAHLRRLCDEVIVVAREPDILPGCRVVTDRIPGKGPLGGIHAGLLAARGELCFLTACDLPCFSEAIAGQLLTLAADCQAALPRDGERLEPLFAVVRKSAALPVAEDLLARDERKVCRLYEALCPRYLDREDWAEGGDPFLNLNRPEDYAEYLRKNP